MLYVNFAGNHLRQLPREIIIALGTELDPDRRIVAMLGARGTVVALEGGAEKKWSGYSYLASSDDRARTPRTPRVEVSASAFERRNPGH
jgi:hypothetical protein